MIFRSGLRWLRKTVACDRRESEVCYQSSSENIYHACMPKTASQWLARILSSGETYRYSGLRAHAYHRNLPGGVDKRKISERSFEEPLPPRTIVTPLYVSLENLLAIPKPASWKAFFVMRDPRDIIVSWYFSWKHSHPVLGGVAEAREKLRTLSKDEGLIMGIERFQKRGMFASLRSWARLPAGKKELMTTRFKDLVGPDQFEHFRRVFAHCDIGMPEDVLRTVLERNSFMSLTSGRPQGVEDVTSHLRKGVYGDWRNHFTTAVERKFRAVTGPLVEELGYAW